MENNNFSFFFFEKLNFIKPQIKAQAVARKREEHAIEQNAKQGR
jgi:hypothetical protein